MIGYVKSAFSVVSACFSEYQPALRFRLERCAVQFDNTDFQCSGGFIRASLKTRLVKLCVIPSAPAHPGERRRKFSRNIQEDIVWFGIKSALAGNLNWRQAADIGHV
ncbi:uncharacterized [Tachysurus ichikawai]